MNKVRVDEILSNYIIEQERKTLILKKVDVIVAGGGPAGFSAAVAAAREGADTLLVERYGFLGGGFTAMLVSPVPLYGLVCCEEFGDVKPLFGGIPQELIKELTKVKGINIDAVRRTQKTGGWVLTDPEMIKAAMQDMVEESGAGLLLHALAVGSVVEGNLVKGVIIESKSGRQAILADVVVDATGDGDVAADAGAPYKRAPVGERLPMSLCSKMANVNVEKAVPFLGDKKRVNAMIKDAIERGELPKPIVEQVLPDIGGSEVDIQIYDYRIDPSNWSRKGEASLWGPHVRGDCTDVMDLTKAEKQTRKNLQKYVRLFQRHAPGFEEAYLSLTATQIGVRESRRIQGEYVLTLEGDIKLGKTHDDVVIKARKGGMELTKLSCGPTFDIPYRCIVPSKIDNLLVAGRCISLDEKAAHALEPREEPTCMALGEAAGIAAALCVKNKIKPRDLDVSKVQKKLKAEGYNI